MDKPLFNLATLPEADEFLDSLAPAVVRKVFYNIRKVAGGETLVIATHGLVKKSQKTPKKEIDKAERIRTEYFASK